MSDAIVLVGATGLVGGAVVQQAEARGDDRIVALARRGNPAAADPSRSIVAPTGAWPAIIADLTPAGLICALGTTWRKAGRSQDGFRSVDQHLVIDCARAAHNAGARRMIVVSAAGADAGSRNFYLSVKGEVEDTLKTIGFTRLDILRPGLLRGSRGADRRVKERLAIAVAPIFDRLLHGRMRAMRSIPGATVARAILALSREAGEGVFIHDNDAILARADTLAD
ncbi:NAD(P)H-binding protein [uncultured Croceicoccus sp.]|uniref:NAD(P)H-binding protein n=1 Tax=uncultured Croceicoccus sp. TaxID=1295329 RepID=UPI002613A063|nr:NAD(P)H-binding protein [uncultured Croceicoccus sp.]